MQLAAKAPVAALSPQDGKPPKQKGGSLLHGLTEDHFPHSQSPTAGTPSPGLASVPVATLADHANTTISLPDVPLLSNYPKQESPQS